MNVLVIDRQYDEQTEKKRGECIRDAIGALGHNCSHQMQVWQEGINASWDKDGAVSSWDDAVNRIRETTPQSVEVFFVHSSNNNAIEFADTCCGDRYLVFYSGAGAGILERDPDLLAHCRKNPKHCICRHQITQDLDSADWDLSAYFRAIKAEDAAFCQLLNKFDSRLEAKLNLLYACLDQQSLDHFLADVADPYGWSVISDLQIPWSGDKTEAISRVLFEDDDKIRRVQDIDLRKLRDRLLGY